MRAVETGKTACPDCHGLFPVEPALSEAAVHPYMGASPGCWKVFGEVMAREYSDPAFFAVHRLTVDAYAVQHPGRPEPRAVQSVNLHLVSLYLLLERDASNEFATRVLGDLAQAHKAGEEFEWLAPPKKRGELTILNVVGAEGAEAHTGLVRAWARSVWQAWAFHHGHVKALAERIALS